MNRMPTPSKALSDKVDDVADAVQADGIYWGHSSDEALVIGASQIYKVYEDNGHVYVLANVLDGMGWDDVTGADLSDDEGGSAPDGPLAGQRLSDFNFDDIGQDYDSAQDEADKIQAYARGEIVTTFTEHEYEGNTFFSKTEKFAFVPKSAR